MFAVDYGRKKSVHQVCVLHRSVGSNLDPTDLCKTQICADLGNRFWPISRSADVDDWPFCSAVIHLCKTQICVLHRVCISGSPQCLVCSSDRVGTRGGRPAAAVPSPFILIPPGQLCILSSSSFFGKRLCDVSAMPIHSCP
jgi:hypothetical protein